MEELAEQCKQVDEKYPKESVQSVEEVKSLMELAGNCVRVWQFEKKSLVYLNYCVEYVKKALSDPVN